MGDRENRTLTENRRQVHERHVDEVIGKLHGIATIAYEIG